MLLGRKKVGNSVCHARDRRQARRIAHATPRASSGDNEAARFGDSEVMRMTEKVLDISRRCISVEDKLDRASCLYEEEASKFNRL